MSSCKITITFVIFLMKLNCLDRFSESTKISNFMKILSLGTQLFLSDWRADRHDEANGHFSQFRNSA